MTGRHSGKSSHNRNSTRFRSSSGTSSCPARPCVHYVIHGRLRPEQGSRGVGRPGPVGLHIDLTDCAALLCARQAPDDPPSRLASAMHVYNELLHRCPEALPRLYEGFEWDRQDEHGKTESPTSGYPVPVFSQRDGVVSCRYNFGWIGKARQRLEQPLTEEETQIFDLMGEISAASCLEFPFHTGDIGEDRLIDEDGVALADETGQDDDLIGTWRLTSHFVAFEAGAGETRPGEVDFSRRIVCLGGQLYYTGAFETCLVSRITQPLQTGSLHDNPIEVGDIRRQIRIREGRHLRRQPDRWR
jgi:hypothetical protein